MSSPGQVNQGLLSALRVLREALKEEKLVLFLGEKISALPQPATLSDWWTSVQDEAEVNTGKLKKLEEDYLQRLGDRPSLSHAALRTLGRFPVIVTTNMDCLVERLVWAPQGIVGECLRIDQLNLLASTWPTLHHDVIVKCFGDSSLHARATVETKKQMEELCTSDGEEARFLEKLFNEQSVLFLGCDPDAPLCCSVLQRFAENSKTRHFVVVPAQQRGVEERGSLSLLHVDLDLPSLAQLLNPSAKPLESPTEKGVPKTSKTDTNVKPGGDIPPGCDVIQLLCLGTGKGTTAVLTGEPSSSMVVLHNSRPVLLVDVGLGVTQSLLHSISPEKFPGAMFVTHNHSDHAGELPLVLGGTAQRRLLAGQPKVKLLCGPKVLEPLKVHRLSEMASQMQPDDAADWLICDPEGDPVYLDDVKHFKLQAVESQHDLPCYGFMLYYKDELILGFSADSGFKAELYDKIFEAPTVVVDGRTPSSKWHASFDEISAYLKSREKRPRAVYVTGYGTAAEYTAEDSALRPLQRGQFYTLWSEENECTELTNEGAL
ncbi:Hypp5286 [Branchiostoma lanceolatum]|uniref:Hypp5286 protein n=1 Tax=Branchiostoma lanceolatum TaxID=7740 RepID=A0A8K0AE26_BRALA|nr:Hypp5286 [Branchiostoma lanceolatum]